MLRIISNLALMGCLIVCATPAFAAIQYDQDVIPDVIFGSGNANGGFTTNRQDGVELGLRAKLRHNQSGQPENTFNSNGDGTYTFPSGVAPTQAFPTAVWSFEWSINTNFDGSSHFKLDDLTYELSMTSTNGAFIPVFDPINSLNPALGRIQWDHAIGDNSTPNGGGASIPNAANDEPGYLTLIGDNIVAQNSWKPHWFATNFDPTKAGTYNFTLNAFDGDDFVGSTSIQINVVPEPGTLALAGLALLGMLGFARQRR